MNYELAKKLKDAGFPQNLETMSAFYCDGDLNTIGDCEKLSEWKNNPDGSGFHTASTSGCGCCSSSIGRSVNDYVVVPTLSELIEACGDNKPAISPWNVFDWQASVPHFKKRQLIQGVGSSPEIAVANLWLALQDNQKE